MGAIEYSRSSKLKTQNSKLAKIVFDGRYIQDRYHGIGRYAYHLAHELAQAPSFTAIEVLRDPALTNSRFDWSSLGEIPNVTVREVTAPQFSLAEQVKLPLLLGGKHRSTTTPYFAVPWLLPARSLVTVHDCIFERDPRYMLDAGRGYITRC